MSWTEDRVETLKKLWAEGHSASQIAKELGGVTRNAVIGKVHRLGLSGRATPSRPVRRPPRLARPKPAPVSAPAQKPVDAKKDVPAAVPVPAKEAAVNLAPKPLASGEVATVLNLRESMCKWPIGDPADKNFAFCGRKASGGPYCTEHAKVAFQPARKRGERKSDAVALPRRAAG